MSSIKCPRCHLVNFASAETCKRCGAALSGAATSNDLSPDVESSSAVKGRRPWPRFLLLLTLGLLAGVILAGSAWKYYGSLQAEAERQARAEPQLATSESRARCGRELQAKYESYRPDIQIRVNGHENKDLSISWPNMSRTDAEQFVKKDDFIAALHRCGFRSGVMSDGAGNILERFIVHGVQ